MPVKRLLVVLGLILLGAAGYVAVGATAWLAGHEGRAAGDAFTKKLITTALQTTTLKGGRVVRYKLRRIVHYKPVYRRQVTTVNGKPVTVRTLVGRKAVTVSRIVTRTRTNTRTNTVVRDSTVTGPSQTVTRPGQTVVVTSTRTETQVEPTTITTTTTVPAVTVTVPITITVG